MKIPIPFNLKTACTASVLLLALLLSSGQAQAQSCIGDSAKIEWRLYENLPSSDIRAMYTSPRFPQNPDYIEQLSNLASPSSNYNNNYGSLIRGFIKAPETGQYVFNLTGDDGCLFFLSQDSTSDELTLRSQVPGWSNREEHDKYPEQTSDTLQLTAGDYYFFQMHHSEGGGGDHIQLYWKTPSTINDSTWTIVRGQYVYDYLCDSTCLNKGVPCDDADPLTENDQWDGNCGCYGTPITLPFGCIGERGSLLVLYYDNITGTYVQDMYNVFEYPLSPDRAEVINVFAKPHVAGFDNYGSRTRGYLRAPATGKYLFNVTGFNEVKLMLSPNETTTPANVICYNDRWASDYDHWDKPHNTSDSIDLVEGQFYSIELVHKEGTSNDDFFVYWKTPLNQDTSFHLLDGSYLYRYACDIACVPEGTPCNDGNPDTFSDKYDNNCNCAGTPCSDPQCSNQYDYTIYEACDENTGNHSTNPNASWLSCEPSQSPNPERGMSHWINYDFGQIYALDSADIWNYNAAGASAQGFQEVAIDYSLDGVNWSHLGNFNWGQATGTSQYGGFSMAEFTGISARYVLLTGLSNFDGSDCFGLSEISFNATTCPDAGTACDDGNPNTTGDTYNEYCYCIGIPIADNDCDSVTMIRNEVPVLTGFYNAELTITSSGLVRAGSNVTYVAGESITLQANFEVEFGAEFYAYIAPCTPVAPDSPADLRKQERELKKAEKQAAREESRQAKLEAEKYAPDVLWLRLSPNPTSSVALVEYNLPLPGKVRLGVFDASGKLVDWMVPGQFHAEGLYQQSMAAQHLPSGTYTVTLFTSSGLVSERLVVVDSL